MAKSPAVALVLQRGGPGSERWLAKRLDGRHGHLYVSCGCGGGGVTICVSHLALRVVSEASRHCLDNRPETVLP